MTNTSLDTSDAIELAEMLQFLTEWLTSDHDHLDASLIRLVGNPAHGASQLHADLHRFAFLLGADNGEQRFGDHTTDNRDWRVT